MPAQPRPHRNAKNRNSLHASVERPPKPALPPPGSAFSQSLASLPGSAGEALGPSLQLARVFCVTCRTHRNSRARRTFDRPRHHSSSARRDGRARIHECGSGYHVGAAGGRGSGYPPGMQEKPPFFWRDLTQETALFQLETLRRRRQVFHLSVRF